MSGVAVPNAGPTPRDLCAVAVNIAARMSYRIYCAWIEETERTAASLPDWEELPNEQRTSAVGFVLHLAANPDMELDAIHDMSVELSGDNMPAEMRVAYALCPSHYCTSLEMTVGVIRAVLDNLVSRRDMREYIAALDAGTDEFMLEN